MVLLSANPALAFGTFVDQGVVEGMSNTFGRHVGWGNRLSEAGWLLIADTMLQRP